MNSKQYLMNEAERLYLYEFRNIEDIAKQLNLGSKTVYNWKQKGDWTNKRKKFLKSKQCFHEEIYEFARKLMKGIVEDMEAGEKIDTGRMYAFCRLIPMFTKVKTYEDVVKKPGKVSNGLTPELIAQIEEEVLGITPDVRNEEQ